MKNSVVGIGIAFMDIVIKTAYQEKNHSHFSNIDYEVGGSILNIVSQCENSGFIYKKGNDAFSDIVVNYLTNKNVKVSAIQQNANMPIFTIINQKERYTSLTKQFEIDELTNIDYAFCNEFMYGVTNSESSKFINQLVENTTTKWIVNSYIPQGTKFELLEGVIMNRDEAKKYHHDPYTVLQKLNNKHIPWAIITLDKDGVIFLENNNIHHLPVKNTSLKSKIRTGDLFTATLIQQLAKQETLQNAISNAMHKVELYLMNTQ